ncbi:hypothetical protein FRC11_000535 [Ceratobasidium sp. 423]|nr:hypothetical protein FRC11_000535 [Ceratobasidium sp. 423]
MTVPNRLELGYQSLLIDQSTAWEHVKSPIGRSKFHFPRRKKVLTVLLIGETGSGKTSFMSLLLNLFQGNGPFELKDKHYGESGLDKSQSQTTEARLYHFTTGEGVKIRVLDTPGLADTRGIEEDKRHKERIYRAIQDLITEIDGVMIIANGRQERLTVATDYTLNILATFFPRSIVDNIGIIFTNTDPSGVSFNFQMQSLPHVLRSVDYWCLDNPLSLYKNYQALKAKNEFGPGKESKLKRTLKYSYEDTVETLDRWLGWLDDRKTVPTSAILDLYQRSTRIESELFMTITSISNLSKLGVRLLDISLDLQTKGEAKEKLADLQKKEPQREWVLQETSSHNTICIAEDCHNNCHMRCSLELSDPATIGGFCRTFKTIRIPNKLLPFWSDTKVKCGQAQCRHEAQFHRNYPKIHKKIDSESYKKLTSDLKDATTEEEKLESAKASVEQEIGQVKQKIQQSKLEIPRLVQELNSLALSPNYAAYIRSASDILKMRKEQLIQRAGAGSELAVINDGIQAFEAQLNILRENEAGRVVETSDIEPGEQVQSGEVDGIDI